MHADTLYYVLAISVSLCVIAGYLIQSGRMFGRLDITIKNNTDAVEKLSNSLDTVVEKVGDHEVRITVLEDRDEREKR